MTELLRAAVCVAFSIACATVSSPVPALPGRLQVPADVPRGTAAPAVAARVTAAPQDVPKEIPREVLKYRNLLIREIRATWGDGEPPETFFGQCHQESRWKTEAKSKYASGLAQFTPDTARWIHGIYPADLGEVCPSAAGCPEDPRWALRALVRYDQRLYGAITGAASVLERWAFTLAGYNSGSGWVTRERATLPLAERGRWFRGAEDACLRRADFCRETRGYVHAILERWAPLYRSWLLR